ncbi:MAG: DEAD/DEAH box helicase [Clostridia bacterium]|jgi:ATP-dependent RNA helicase DeaD|nr:DEAD/DEAH box helicase [Clostridiales bacterium]
MTTFYEMGLSSPIVRATDTMGFEEATPIQERTIPLLMEGRDVIGQAQTGTGKTAAFGIPLIERIEKDSRKVEGLVITPTRELAIQVAEEINRIGQYKGIHALPIYGGQDIKRQIKALGGKPQIIVGTPGRLMDHMRRKTIRLQQVSMVVLDEADEMLNMGFLEDIETIMAGVPDGAQTMLFSATMPKPIRQLAERFMDRPELVRMQSKGATLPGTEQYYYEVQDRQKFDVLCRLLDIQSPDLCIVFARTKRRVDEIFEALSKRGYLAEGIHSDLTQAKRNLVMRRFRDGAIDILVATDVAARGLDISNVSHVYNFDIPQDPESYVHRIGRTGRAGRTGEAITFVTPRELGQLKQIERIINRKISRRPIPTVNEAIEGQQQLAVDRLLKVVADKKGIGAYKELAKGLLETEDSVTLLSAALKLLTKETDTTPVILTDERPKHSKKHGKNKLRQPKGRHSNRYNKKFYKDDKSYNKKKEYQRV